MKGKATKSSKPKAASKKIIEIEAEEAESMLHNETNENEEEDISEEEASSEEAPVIKKKRAAAVSKRKAARKEESDEESSGSDLSSEETKKPSTRKKSALEKQEEASQQKKEYVLEYLRQKNGPTSAVQVKNYLQTVCPMGSTLIKKILQTLTSEGLITERIIGIAGIYCIVQEDVDGEELQKLQEEIGELEKEVSARREAAAGLQAEKEAFESELSNEALRGELECVSKELEIKEARLSRFLTEVGSVDPKEKEKLEKKRAQLQKESKKRRGILNNITSQIHESAGISKAKLFEDAGISSE
ncbi:26S proteasome regulatory subunit, ATPase 3, interacting protein [Nematocida sp. AWRm77]|nr:26S proteasome regulatory subunit, ATPase 3, interacting protein [Nematocida sp. AWRm77]